MRADPTSRTLVDVASYDDVARLALALPGTREGVSRGWRVWSVGDRMFVWERPFTQADLRRFGDDPVPAGPILAAAVDDAAPAAGGRTERLAEGAATGEAPLTPIQHWFLDAITDHPDHWNQSYLLEIDLPLDGTAIEAVARALVARPEVLVMDEPTAGVDRASQLVLASVLQRLGEAGTTMLVVTHELTALRGIVDRIVAERPDAADEPEAFCQRVGAVLEHELAALLETGPGNPADRARRYV